MSGPLFVFAGGGTGGHLFPGIAVASSLERLHPDARFLFAGSGRTVEQSILAEAGFEAVPLQVPPMASAVRHPLRFLTGHLADCLKARRLVRGQKPAAVIGLGGLASLAMCDAAGRNRVPVVLLEQNVIPGRATRRMARRFPLCTSFEETRDLPASARVVCTGNPLRYEITRVAASPGQIAARTTLLILGGSQGSTQVNDAVLQAAGEIRNHQPDHPLWRWDIIHQSGPGAEDTVTSCWKRLGMNARVEPFFSDLPDLYAQAALVITRSGATTLAELACLNLPSILLPYEHARDDHQTANARVFEQAGAAARLETRRSDLAGQLASVLGPLVESRSQREAMSNRCRILARPNAADTVAGFISAEAGLAGHS